MRRRESGGRGCRQPGQILTEAATVILLRVVPAPNVFLCHKAEASRPLYVHQKENQPTFDNRLQRR